MKKLLLFIAMSFTTILVAPAMANASTSVQCASSATGPGFNQCGYNYDARIFVGKADGVDTVLNGEVWGDPTYANDHLVMKWNAAWDACNANGYDNPTYCLGAWDTNEWNGMGPNGSKSTEHVKIIWVGSLATDSPYWVPGGYSIWGNYEAIEDQGMVGGQHIVWAAARPEGLK